MKKILEILLSTLTPVLEGLLTEKFAAALRKIKPDTTRRDLLVTLYVPIDTQLEKVTEETATKLDDAGVRAMKAAIEIVAAEDGIQLPNIDND